MRVLVVDSNRSVRQTIKYVLETRAHEVVLAEDGRQGLALYAAERPDLVLTDLVMPMFDGLQLIAAIRAKDRSIPIIAMTAGARAAGAGVVEVARARELGVDAVLRKPFDPDGLLGLVADHGPASAG
jgi:CheY-like chemotaxis protein